MTGQTMRNLSATGAIHSPIDADRDVSAYITDFKALGLQDHSPFDILRRPQIKCAAPKKRGTNFVSTGLVDLPAASHFNTDIMSREESDRTASIRLGVA
jgi:hypothetical protein